MRRFIIQTGFFLFGFLHTATAQCNFETISGAEELYNFGRFEEARSRLNQCLDNNAFGRDDNNNALRILALIAIAEDDISTAETLIEKIVRSNPDFKYTPHIVFDLIFKSLVKKYQVITVSSVSKRAENIWTAPANVQLIDRQDILARGYTDLIELLSDLPGFDISRIYSATYANVYQLGFRQENTERTLLMIDGVEENDIWSNIAYISRQYPISNIKAVEVLYGPSSTMYGPRSFVGAINIITYPPGEKPDSAFSKDEPRNNNSFYGFGNLMAGSYNTADADVTIGVKKDDFSFSFTGRYFYSDENDLSGYDFYDYDPKDVDALSYRHLRINNTFRWRDGSTLSAQQYLNNFNIPEDSPLLNIFRNSGGQIDSVTLSQAGIDYARELDRNFYTGNVNGFPNGYSNHTKDWFVGGKLSFGGFELGVRSWRREEGLNYYQDLSTPGSRNGNLWVPRNNTLYAKIERSFKKTTLFNLLSFHNHFLDRATNRVNFRPLGALANGFHLAHLFYPDSLIHNISGSTLVKPGYSNLYFYYGGQQLRNDMRFFFDTDRLNLVTGAEFRSSQMQGDYLTYTSYSFEEKPPKIAYAQEFGTVSSQNEGSNIFAIIDMSAYAQGTYKLIPDKLFLTAGARIDYNRIRASGGFGTDLTHRLVLVYKLGQVYLKFINSDGIQNVSQWTKYSTGGGRIPNPTLNTERINFSNITAEGISDNKALHWSALAYYCYISDAVASSTVNNILMNRNIGEYQILGAMANLAYTSPDKNIKADLNYTFMAPYDTDADDPADNVRVGDIASHHFNAGISYRLRQEQGLQSILALRSNYVSKRPVGPNTTQSGNPGLNDSGFYPEYLILNGSLSLSHRNIKGLSLHITANNILNKEYFHPGPRTAAANYSTRINDFVNFMPQRGRHFFIKTSFLF